MMRILHVLSQRPSHTGSGTTLNAIVSHAAAAGWEQQAVVGTPADDAQPAIGDLPGDFVHPLVFEQPPVDFPLPGMSDVMPYRSSRFFSLTSEQLEVYRE